MLNCIIETIRPKAVIGFGGYPTLPPLYAATRRGVPTMIHEQNAVMGRANKALATRAMAIAGGFLEAGKDSRIVVTGNPVRPSVIEASATPYEVSRSGDPFHLLVFGGSQGAQFFSSALPEAIRALPAELRSRLKVTQQARADDEAGLCRSRYRGRGLALLQGHGEAHRVGPARHLALGCVDRFGTCGNWPSLYPRSLSPCARPRPGRQCGRSRFGGRSARRAAIGPFGRAARRTHRRLHDRPGPRRQNGAVGAAIAAGQTVTQFSEGGTP